MYAQIMIDCQTQTDYITCEYCIANKTCQLRTSLEENKKKTENEQFTFTAPFTILIDNSLF